MRKLAQNFCFHYIAQTNDLHREEFPKVSKFFRHSKSRKKSSLERDTRNIKDAPENPGTFGNQLLKS